MLEEHPVKNYGLNDLATGYYIKKLAKDLEVDNATEKNLSILNSELVTIEDYEAFLKVKVILEYSEFIEHIASSSIKSKLKRFYGTVSEVEISNNAIRGKIIQFINQNSQRIFSSLEYDLKDESLDIALKNSGGIKSWEKIIEHANDYLLFHRYDELYQILHKKSLDKVIILTKKLLFPVTFDKYVEQLEIALRVQGKLKEIYVDFQSELYSLIESKSFDENDNMTKVKLMRDVLGSGILGIKGEMMIQEKLKEEEEIYDSLLEENGTVYEITSKDFALSEEKYKDFKEKFFILTYIDLYSVYEIMQYDGEKQGILDHVTYMNGVKHEKYGKVSFAIKYKDMTTQNILNTMHIMNKYGDEFWDELSLFSKDISQFTGITDFLKSDLFKLKKLVNSEEWMLACSFITQLIERLLRELFLQIIFGKSGIFNEASYTLGSLLNFNVSSDLNRLLLLFSKAEIETINYYLINKEYGWNLRNRIAHYNINSEELSIGNFCSLLHILVFILTKIEYQGEAFEK